MTTKECKWCKSFKNLSEFSKNKREKDGYRRHCRTCCSTYEQSRYKKDSFVRQTQAKGQSDRLYRNRLFIYEYLKEHSCVDCLESDPIVLEFDHVRGKKKAPISQLVAQCFALNTIKKEIEKCEVRCANCHRRKTSAQFFWYDKSNPPLPKHRDSNTFYQKMVERAQQFDPLETSPNIPQDTSSESLAHFHMQTLETIQK